MWIEWPNGLLNLNYIHRVYLEEYTRFEGFTDFSQIGIFEMNGLKSWRLVLKHADGIGEFEQTFEDENEASEAYEKIKQKLISAQS